jgi:hypothetical protein
MEKSLKFDDPSLHARFVEDLVSNGVPHHLAETGAVECSESEWGKVNAIAHNIRHSCFFPWYFVSFNLASQAAAVDFLGAMREANLPFQLEHHKNETVFVLPEQYMNDYDEILVRFAAS